MDPPRKRIITIRAGVLIVDHYEGGKHGEYKIPYDGNPKRLRHQAPRLQLDPIKGRLVISHFDEKEIPVTLAGMDP